MPTPGYWAARHYFIANAEHRYSISTISRHIDGRSLQAVRSRAQDFRRALIGWYAMRRNACSCTSVVEFVVRSLVSADAKVNNIGASSRPPESVTTLSMGAGME